MRKNSGGSRSRKWRVKKAKRAVQSSTNLWSCFKTLFFKTCSQKGLELFCSCLYEVLGYSQLHRILFTVLLSLAVMDFVRNDYIHFAAYLHSSIRPRHHLANRQNSRKMRIIDLSVLIILKKSSLLLVHQEKTRCISHHDKILVKFCSTRGPRWPKTRPC